MAKPLMVKIDGPGPSRTKATAMQYTVTVVSPSGTVRCLTWDAEVTPVELAHAILEAADTGNRIATSILEQAAPAAGPAAAGNGTR